MNSKPRYVQVTDLAEIEAVKRGMKGELQAPIGGYSILTTRTLGGDFKDEMQWFAEVESLAQWREHYVLVASHPACAVSEDK